MLTFFTFDIERNYCKNDINEYLKRISILSQNYPGQYTIVPTHPIQYNQESWIKRQSDLSTIPTVFRQKALWIFFEIPERVRNYYIKFGIPYLNFMTPKVRFPNLPDRFILESNLDLPEDIFYKIPKADPGKDPSYFGKTLILGQMYGDRSVIFGGKPYSILEYEINGDIFRPHPHTETCQPSFHQECLRRASEMGLEVRTDGDIYKILRSVDKAVAISSSALYEAEILGAEVQFLGEKEYIKVAKDIKYSDLTAEFWQTVLDLV